MAEYGPVRTLERNDDSAALPSKYRDILLHVKVSPTLPGILGFGHGSPWGRGPERVG